MTEHCRITYHKLAVTEFQVHAILSGKVAVREGSIYIKLLLFRNRNFFKLIIKNHGPTSTMQGKGKCV